jgi:hypothetical protein
MKKSLLLVLATASVIASLRLSAELVPPKAGWPQATGLLVDRSSPGVGNLDDDVDLEIVVGTVGKKVYAFNPNGTLVPGWPVTVTGEVNSSPAIGDIDGDGFNEVVVGVGWQDLTNDGGIYAFRRNGQVMAGWPFVTKDLNLGPNGHPDGVFATPALVDLDLDGKLDIVVGSFDQYLYALRYDGQAVAGAWPFFLYDGTWSSAAIGDLDRDGEPEIVISAYTHAGFPPGLPTVDGGGIMWVLTRTGAVKPGWPRVFDLHIDSSPALGDLDGDGDLEIVVGTGHEPATIAGRRVYAVHHDATDVTGWPVSTGAFVWPSPALADLDGNGLPEVIVSCEDGKLYAWKANGTLLAGWPVQPLNESGVNGGMSGSPVAADLNGDGAPEVLVPIGWDVVAFSGNGSVFKYPGDTQQLRFRTLFSVGGTATVKDLDGNGRLEVAIGSANGAFDQGRLYVWELPAAAIPGVSPWPMFRRGPGRTGLLSQTAPVGSSLFTLTPCRVFDTRESSGPTAAAPALSAGERRIFQMAGKCGIPSDAKAVSINVTVTQAGAAGDVKVTPGDQLTTLSSTLSFAVGRTRASVTLVRLSTDGLGTIAATNTAAAAVHLIVDVNGYFR